MYWTEEYDTCQKWATFLDIICQQVVKLNEKYNTKIPLVLMNSLNTEQETKKACLPYPLEVLHFNQNYLPKLSIDLKPLAGHNNRDHPELWYPPGHGDIYRSLKESGIVTELRNRVILHHIYLPQDIDVLYMSFVKLFHKIHFLKFINWTIKSTSGSRDEPGLWVGYSFFSISRNCGRVSISSSE